MDPPPRMTCPTSSDDITKAERSGADIERLLQAGSVEGYPYTHVETAIRLGWSGDKAVYRLVRTGEGTQPLEIRLRGKSLGFEVSNDLGIALVTGVSVGSELKVGDVLRAVNGVTLYTCEAVVGAIRSATTAYGEVSLGVGRPTAETQIRVLRLAPPPLPASSCRAPPPSPPPEPASVPEPVLSSPLLHVPTTPVEPATPQQAPDEAPVPPAEESAAAKEAPEAAAEAEAEPRDLEAEARADAALSEAIEAGDLVELICAIAAHSQAANGSAMLARAWARRDELARDPSAEGAAEADAAKGAAAEAAAAAARHASGWLGAPAPTMLALTFDNLQLLDVARKGYMSQERLEQSVHAAARRDSERGGGGGGGGASPRGEGGGSRRPSFSGLNSAMSLPGSPRAAAAASTKRPPMLPSLRRRQSSSGSFGGAKPTKLDVSGGGEVTPTYTSASASWPTSPSASEPARAPLPPGGAPAPDEAAAPAGQGGVLRTLARKMSLRKGERPQSARGSILRSVSGERA